MACVAISREAHDRKIRRNGVAALGQGLSCGTSNSLPIQQTQIFSAAELRSDHEHNIEHGFGIEVYRRSQDEITDISS